MQNKFSDGKALGRWEGLAKQGLDFPHPWIPGLLTPPPGAPGFALAKVVGKENSNADLGVAHPLPGPIVPGLREAGPLASPKEIPRAEWAQGPAPFLKLGLCVCKRGGSGIWDTPPFAPSPPKAENPS